MKAYGPQYIVCCGIFDVKLCFLTLLYALSDIWALRAVSLHVACLWCFVAVVFVRFTFDNYYP
jgi:hypothetical protein